LVLEVVGSVLEVPVLAQAVPVEARKQSHATLPLSQAAERLLQGAWSREVAPEVETEAALEVVQVAEQVAEQVAALEVGTEAAQV
jgi:hypothetical protein